MSLATRELLERLVAQAERFAASGATPALPRLSATVLLLRPAEPGFEVYLQRRATSMAFASGRYVFPGGTVDPADYDPATGDPPGCDPSDISGADWAARLGRPEPDAVAVVRAAVRELAEETGVRVSAADLVPWSRWITPEFEPRRYDTSFFLTISPAGQEPANVSGEADLTEWLAPAEAVARCEAGDIAMLPPTLVTVTELSAYRTVDAALAAAAGRDAATPVMPTIDDLRALARR